MVPSTFTLIAAQLSDPSVIVLPDSQAAIACASGDISSTQHIPETHQLITILAIKLLTFFCLSTRLSNDDRRV